ncbi:DUF4179 domain-containing protein [Zunongwangia sp. SCSIO 43204]|uniref:DUF4179 domain-containing protein n=1 Tax=Zunongwangia sp. SCSIO 43204 TaxID=2779359 RepID=UPI001CA955CE|nr:DUF4179 domain-containing protein [Zunongwangia sp. SCSIO 43204]UAB82916.1 DUF4179 domain-containing protein [Zunongwangia sp. SCSIO 43204]|tara:strand:+ start:167 stop:727 length:561 start_codon:yes stop_codon:yes gene_type:complete
MKNDEFFEDLKGLNFDISEPDSGHKDRFLEKLEQKHKNEASKTGKLRKLWIPLSSIAAALIIAFIAFGNVFNTPAFAKEADLAAVSPQMKETQDFYSTLIERELKSIEGERSPKTNKIINDALVQLETLEKEYNKLKKDLLESGQDKRVIYAMINNFQKRIDLLNQVLDQIETIKQLNTQENETII